MKVPVFQDLPRPSLPFGRDIVVLGASAGGLSVFDRLLMSLPADLPAAVFMVLHVSPVEWWTEGYTARLDRDNPLKVVTASDGLSIEPCRVYVCPPDRHLVLELDVMRLEKSPKENHVRPSVDVLFRTAARAYGRRVIAVLLSGTLNDGTAGIWQIKKRGGVTIVQQPREAQFSSMPQSAIDNVAIDFVLPVEEIAQKLIELTRRELSETDNCPTSALIVEDERVTAENLWETLEELGYDVCEVVTTGEFAIAVAQATNPDIVLMGIHLAGKLTGIEAARTIWERLQIPVVYVTSFGDWETLKAAVSTENHGYVVKPFHSAAVDAAIQLALERRRRESRL